MSHRDVAFATEEVQLAGKYAAWVRPLTGPEHQAVQEALIGGPITRYVADSSAAKMDNNAYIAAALSAFIVKWNLDDDSHDIIPINKDTVMNELSAREQAALMEAYRRLNQPLADPDVLTELRRPLSSSGAAMATA